MATGGTNPIIEIDGVIYVDRDAISEFPSEGETVYGRYQFEWGGSVYYWNENLGWIRVWVDERGMLQRSIVDNVFWGTASTAVQNPFAHMMPDAMKQKPMYAWDQPLSNGIVASYHLDQRRLLRTAAFVAAGEPALEIPLLDDDNVPWVTPDQPWPMIVRLSSNSSDYVADPDSPTDMAWTDKAFVPSGANIMDSGQNYGAEVFMRLKRDPVPHWVLHVSIHNDDSSSLTDHTVLVDIIGSGYGEHSASYREEGSASTVGHWKTSLVWTQQGFMAAAGRSAWNGRKYGQGCIYVANDPTGVSPGQLWLTTGGSEGTSGGTSLFSDLPAVIVFGHATLGSDVTASAYSAWKPESWGMGLGTVPNTGVTAAGMQRAYQTQLIKDSGTGKYYVYIYNTGNDTTGVANSGYDRTFFVDAFGVG